MDTDTTYAQPVQPPAPPVAPPDYPLAAGTPAPKKKRKGCIIAAVIALVLLCGCIGTAVVVGLVLKSEEEAVTYTEADFDSAVAKVGVTWPELPEGANPDEYERVYSGQRPADITLTSAEISALVSFRHGSSYWPIKSMDVEITGANTATASMVVSYAGRDWPVTASGSGAAAGGGIDLNVESASVAGLEVPAEYLPMGSEFLEDVINPRLARAGITIDSFEATPEGVHFVGTVWETAEYVPTP